jgi:hypothetical protein
LLSRRVAPRSRLGDPQSSRWVTLRARWVTLRARWVTLRASQALVRCEVSVPAAADAATRQRLLAHQVCRLLWAGWQQRLHTARGWVYE